METMIHLCAVVGGLIASLGFILRVLPVGDDVLKKLVGFFIPFQGIIGLVLLVVGAMGLFQSGFSGAMLATLTLVAMVVVGFILAYGLLDKYIFDRTRMTDQAGIAVQKKLLMVQTPFGLLLLVVGIMALVA